MCSAESRFSRRFCDGRSFFNGHLPVVFILELRNGVAGENFGTLFIARAVFVALGLDDDQMFGFKKWVILVTHH